MDSYVGITSYFKDARIRNVLRDFHVEIATEFGSYIPQKSLGTKVHPLELLPKNPVGIHIATTMYLNGFAYPVFTIDESVFLFYLDQPHAFPLKMAKTEFRRNLGKLTNGLLTADSFR